MKPATAVTERTRTHPAAPLFVEFADGRFELVADGRSRLSIPLADVTAVGEFTNAAGPWSDDYFMVLRYRTAGGEEELEVPFNENSGACDVYGVLLAALGAPRTFCLVNCTHPASVFLWPPDRAGTPIWPDYGPARSLGTDRDYARWRKDRRGSRDTRPQPSWRGADPATTRTMNRLLVKLQNDRIFREGSFPDMRSEYVPDIVAVPVARTTEFRLRDHLLKTDTISAVLSFPGRRVCALNFANANFPGGGYVLGGNAQEEALCRASLLYYTIRTARGFYRRNRLHVLPDYTHGMIDSSNVPVVRDGDGRLLDRPAVCDFITSPAVNRTLARFLFLRATLDRTMEERIGRIVALAARKRPDVLVLGAYGCGVFGNRRETVYPQFERAINRYLPDEVQVVFADPHPQA